MTRASDSTLTGTPSTSTSLFFFPCPARAEGGLIKASRSVTAVFHATCVQRRFCGLDLVLRGCLMAQYDAHWLTSLACSFFVAFFTCPFPRRSVPMRCASPVCVTAAHGTLQVDCPPACRTPARPCHPVCRILHLESAAQHRALPGLMLVRLAPRT